MKYFNILLFLITGVNSLTLLKDIYTSVPEKQHSLLNNLDCQQNG